MRPFFDDYDELDDSGFGNFAATRRLLSEKPHLRQKAGGRKRHARAHHERWAGDDADSWDEFYDYGNDDFDRDYPRRDHA